MTAVEAVRSGISKSAIMVQEYGMTIPSPSGKLLRPLTALSFVSADRQHLLDDRFWLGCLAIQMVHEASIYHDDVFDGGMQRRNTATLLATKGIGASVLVGDLYLTGAYRVASLTGYHDFLTAFIKAVETMVRGENIQDSITPSENLLTTYEQIVRMKSGQLFGIAAALPSWSGHSDLPSEQLLNIGINLGIFYQMVDDFLDYCPTGETGKPKLQDFNNRIWTFVLGSHGTEWFEQSADQALKAFFTSKNAPSLAEIALSKLQDRGSSLISQIQKAAAQPPMVEMIEEWLQRCAHASRPNRLATPKIYSKLSLAPKPERSLTAAQIGLRAQKLGDVSDWGVFFQRNSRSFSYASRLFPRPERSIITEIYLFCRFTDNLADKGAESIAHAYEILNVWDQIAYSAYQGNATGIPVADVVMGRMASMVIPYSLISELIEGMRMDVEPSRYSSMEELRLYTYRVASVVGDWITQAFGVRDSWVLERAHDLGHAMQLTNIVRDVGEDLSMGRLYLPADLMDEHQITLETLKDLKEKAFNHGFISPNYTELIEAIIAEANSAYDRAYEGIPFLPTRLRRAIAVAARVYRGIHDEIRSNQYNNLTSRAYTSSWKKTILARKGLTQLRQVSQNPKPSNTLNSAT
ncbi:MAG: squalene/phytoene synthase family protein [Bacteroidetes bacterium]|nr:squalene/phytoene synthase family protein [Bacteroidota bacterium]MCY4223709.1 squalene/phytoene synthase family protein [Bacteroidota bacterium]